jgi:hypothetical protein
MRRRLGLAAAAAAVIAGGAWGARRGDPPRGPAVAWMGAHSRIAQERFARVSTPETWADLWHEHTGEGKRLRDAVYALEPEIDFARFEVVAFFRGPSINTDGERVVEIDQGADRVRIRFNSMGYQTMSLDGRDDGVRVEPFGIWVIDRTGKPIVVEENVQSIIGQPPVWKERHRFDAPAK